MFFVIINAPSAQDYWAFDDEYEAQARWDYLHLRLGDQEELVFLEVE